MKSTEKYINLQIHVNFANEKVDDILEDIRNLLERHGYSEFSFKGEHDGSYEIDTVNFFPSECI